MSGSINTPRYDNPNVHGYKPEGHESNGQHASLKGYLTGFILSVILTIIPFWLVLGDVFSSTTVTIGIILVLGAIQIGVHLFFFLHMTSNSEEGWQIMVLYFTLILLIIIIIGSVMIFQNLAGNTMLPGM